MSCFLIIVPKNNNLYKRNIRTIFLITFLIIVFSEASLRYSTVSNFSSFLYLIIPWILFLYYLFNFYRQIKNA